MIKNHNAIRLRRIYCCNLLLLMFTLPLTAQDLLVSGKVTDGQLPISGATISVKNTTTGAVSDFDGRYSITAKATDTLQISYLGYTTLIIPVQGRTIINVTLQEDATTLGEVQINAGYYTTTDRERTGSISRITAKDIEMQPVSNPLAAMQGRMAGVNITQSAGTPGSGFSIQIRGINSLRSEGNDPLYIIDGVPYASQSLRNNTVSGTAFAGMSSPLSNLNPADIDSIEVLKDADATAIYGSRGANGVVLITTKRGRSGKTRFDLQSYTTIGKITNKLDLLNSSQYLAMRQEAFANDGITQYPDDAYDVNGTWDQNRYTDWQKDLIGGTANIYNAQLSVSGGTASTQFLLSGTYRKETTVFPGDAHFNRAAVHTNISHRSDDDKFSLMFSANYSGDKNTLPGLDLTRQSYTLAPNAPALYDENGDLNWQDGTFENPLAYLNGSYLNTTNTLITNAILSYKLPAGFEFKTSLGYTDSKLSETRAFPSTIYNPFYNLTSADSQILVNNATRRSWIVEPQLDWQRKTENLQLNVLVGTTFQTQKQQSLALDGYGFPSNVLIYTLAAASTITILQDHISEYKYNAIYGRVNLIAKNRYIVNLTGRRDGSSRFGSANRFANFGAAGVGWIFSKEPFLTNENSILSFGKWRASYGVTGNDQIGDYQYLDTYQVTPNVYDGVTGVQSTRLLNPNFGWETNKKLETALELGFFKDRIFLTTAYFRNRSSNQLVGIPLPATTGFPSLQANLNARVENTGFELELRSANFLSKDFSWITTFNFTTPRNKLLSFPGLETSTYRNRFVIGQSINIQKLYHYTGIDSETGLYTVEDVNDDGLISAAGDLTSFIHFGPKYYGGLTNQFTYKNWTFDFLFQFVKQKGADILSAYKLPGAFSNQPTHITNHFPENGASATVQQYSSGNNVAAAQAFNNYVSSDAIIQDASFVRLKNISLAYDIPSLWSNSASVKVYLQGQNLLTFTNYNGADPENRSGFYLPPLRLFTIGVQLSF